MAITELPPAPSRADPANFSDEADALLGALDQFVTEANAQAAALTLNDTTDTSSSSVVIGTGAKTFTVTAAKSFQPGMWLVIADAAAPSTNSMMGQITSYSGTTLIMNITVILGSGTKSSWIISQSAPVLEDTSDVVTTRGDIIRGDASGEAERLAVGTNGQVLTSDGTDAAWATPAASPVTTRGDIIRGDSSGDAERLAVGTAGQVLTSDGTDAAWTTPAASPVTTRGDIIRGDSSGDAERLAVGTAGQVLTSDGTDAEWSNTITGAVLQDCSEESAAVSSSSNVLTLDYTAGPNFTITLTENVTTLTLSNWPTSGEFGVMAVEITQAAGSAYTIAWGSIDFGDAGAPDLSTLGSVTLALLRTVNGGTTVYANANWQKTS